MPLARVVDEDPAHQLRRDSEEMRPVLPIGMTLLDEAYVCFVDQSGSLQGVVAALAPEAGGS